MKMTLSGPMIIYLFSLSWLFASDNPIPLDLLDAVKVINEKKAVGERNNDLPQPNLQLSKNQQSQPQIDTTAAYQAGLRDGAEAGRRDGRRDGYWKGVKEGEEEGRKNGEKEGREAGRSAGYTAGYPVDQSLGRERGYADGQRAGITDGTNAGKKRCYEEGYSEAYKPAFEQALQLGLQDISSYNEGYAKGQADAAVIEAEKGYKAGYQAGFSQREAELQSDLLDKNIPRFTKSMTSKQIEKLSIDLVRHGYTTPEERKAYEKGYKEGYRRAYWQAYEEGRRQGYNERYYEEYRRAYDHYYTIGYKEGFLEGKQAGYQNAYNSAYRSAYDSYFYEYKMKEYPEERAKGARDGKINGEKEGFEKGCAIQRQRGYEKGYAEKAAQVYPEAFEKGKKAGIAAADRYYSENAVLKVSTISLEDENGNGKFEAGENVIVKAEVVNFGFQRSETISISVKSQRGEIALVPDLKADEIPPRSKSTIAIKIGRLYDVVAPNMDTLSITFSEKGRTFGKFEQTYMRTNPNKVGIVTKDNTPVLKKVPCLFDKCKIATLNKGAKVIIIGKTESSCSEDENGYYTPENTCSDNSYYKVRKSEMAVGNWQEGFIYHDRIKLQ